MRRSRTTCRGSRAYHQALFDELKARKLDIRLLATDASPISAWDTDRLGRPRTWTRSPASTAGTTTSRSTPRTTSGSTRGSCRRCNGAPAWRAAATRISSSASSAASRCRRGQPSAARRWTLASTSTRRWSRWSAIQLAEAAIAAINGGIYAMGYWTFADFPDSFAGDRRSADRQRLRQQVGRVQVERQRQLHAGPLLRLRPADEVLPRTGDGLPGHGRTIRGCGWRPIRHQGAGTWSLAVVNRNSRAVPLSVTMDGTALSASFRKYVYDPREHSGQSLRRPSGPRRQRWP